MKALDFFFLMVIASTVAMAYWLQWYATGIYLFLFFLSTLVAVSLHYISQPHPRYIIGAVAVSKEELEDKLKEENEDK